MFGLVIFATGIAGTMPVSWWRHEHAQRGGHDMFGLGMSELVIILVLALIIFGPGKLPEVGKAVGKALREFKQAGRALTDDDKGS